VGLRQGILTDTGRGTDDEVRFVYFHSSGEAIPPRTHQGASQLMQPRPGRTGTAQAQDALAPQRTHSVLLAGHRPPRAKPQPQRLLGILEDRARDH